MYSELNGPLYIDIIICINIHNICLLYILEEKNKTFVFLTEIVAQSPLRVNEKAYVSYILLLKSRVPGEK